MSKDLHVISANLKAVVPDAGHITAIQDAVGRIHRIGIDATELLSLHITRCFEEGLNVPLIDDNYIKMVHMEVSKGGGTRSRVDVSLAETRDRYMPSLCPVDRTKLDQMLMAQSKALAANFVTNLSLHFRKRISRFVRHYHPRPQERLTSEEHRKRKLELMRVSSDMCKPSGVVWESDVAHHPWIQAERQRLGLDALLAWSMEENVKKFQHVMLRASWMINRELEDAGQRCFSICPIRRQMRPTFCQIDTNAIRTLLALDRSYEREQAKRKKEQKQASIERRKKVAEARERAGMAIGSRCDDFDHSRWVAPFGTIATVCSIQRHVRGWVVRRKYLKLYHTHYTLGRAKSDTWEDVLVLKRNVKVARGCRFAGSIRTDGVSVRLFFERDTAASAQKNKKRKRGGGDNERSGIQTVDGLPRPGLYSIDEIKHLSRIRQAQIIGADPGKRELLACVDIDDVPDQLTFKHRKVNSVRYTNAQRRAETFVKEHAAYDRAEVPDALRIAQDELSKHSSRSSHMDTIGAYFKCRREALTDTLAHYGHLKYRERAWSRFIRTQKSLTDFVRRIRGMRREGAPMILAYGSWANVAGRPGTVCNRGIAPCPGVGLRKKLSHHFIVVDTPEHYTSKMCSACGSLCGPCEEVDAEHRKIRMASAKTEEEKKKASRFSVRGIRQCTNERCGVHLNRDLNAATNIGIRCKSLLLSGRDALPSHEKEDDQEFARLVAEIHDR